VDPIANVKELKIRTISEFHN